MSTQRTREGKHIRISGRDSRADWIHRSGNSMTSQGVSQVLFWRRPSSCARNRGFFRKATEATDSFEVCDCFVEAATLYRTGCFRTTADRDELSVEISIQETAGP